MLTTYVLIHGAGSDSWYWHLVVPELQARGHDVVAPDLPCDDDSAGLSEYVDVVVDAIGDRTNLVVVAQSMGGFTAPLVCDRVAVTFREAVASAELAGRAHEVSVVSQRPFLPGRVPAPRRAGALGHHP